jgi:hypothetical protein
LEAVFVLLESLSPSRRIFIGSHSLPPLWFAVSVTTHAEASLEYNTKLSPNYPLRVELLQTFVQDNK